MSAETAILNVLRLWWPSPSSASCGLQIPSLLRVIVRVWVGSTQFREGDGSHRPIHSKKHQTEGEQCAGHRVGPECMVNKQGFPLSLQCYLAILVLLSHTMISVENPVSSPSHWGSQCSAMCPAVLISGHTPAGYVPHGEPWGLSLFHQSLWSFLPRWSKEQSRGLFLPSTEGCEWTPVQQMRSSLFLFNLIKGILCC